MRRNILVFLLLGLGMMSLTAYPADVRSVDDQVKSMAQRYTQVEAQLDRSVHYIRKEASGAETTIEQAWFNGAHDLIKVVVERTDSSGREEITFTANLNTESELKEEIDHIMDSVRLEE
jgi:hypothetical protein